MCVCLYVHILLYILQLHTYIPEYVCECLVVYFSGSIVKIPLLQFQHDFDI